MSTSPDEPADPIEAPRGRGVRVLRAAAVVAAVVSLFTLWSGERVRVADDLQLVAENGVRAGETIALRAFLLRDVDAPAGPTLEVVPVRVRLLDDAGRELASGLLHPTAMDDMEGALRVPATARGALVLEASARREGQAPLVCRRALEVSDNAPELRAQARAAGPLQQLSLGAVQALGGAAPPTPLSPRIVGGGCVPEQPCTMLVWVGEPAASVSMRSNAAVSQVEAPVPAGETSGIVALRFVVHGLEAETVIAAERAGQRVALRAVRLPIALGEPLVTTNEAVIGLESPVALRLALPPGRKHAIADVFAAGRWRATRTLVDVREARPIELRSEGLFVPGLVRLQVRADRFSGESSGARVVYVRAPGESDAHALGEIARFVRRVLPGEATDGWAVHTPAFALADPQRAAAYLLAPLETLRVPIPLSVSGRPAQLARLDQAKTLVRFAVAALLVLGALVVGVSLMMRGLRASDQASSLLTEEAEASERTRGSLAERLRVVALVLSVCVAFLLAALLIAAKPLWF